MFHENLSFAELKTHAKLLSRKLSIPLGHAQEIIAYRYACDNWSKLKSHFNENQGFKPTAYADVLTNADKQSVIYFLIPHIPNLARSNNIALKLEDSLLSKVVKHQWNAISPRQYSLFSEDESPFGHLESIDYWKNITIDELLQRLTYLDDSVCVYLRNDGYNNQWLESEFFCQRIYGRNNKKGKHVYFDIAEWDWDISSPSTPIHTAKRVSHFIFARPWFTDASVNYLKLLSRQFKSLGFEVTFRVQHIHGASLWKCYHQKNSYDLFSLGLSKTVDELIASGGRFVFDTDDAGNKYHHGLEVAFDNEPFNKQACYINEYVMN